MYIYLKEAAKCTGLSSKSILKYKNGPNESTIHTVKKPKHSVLNETQKSEIRNVIYDFMLKASDLFLLINVWVIC